MDTLIKIMTQGESLKKDNSLNLIRLILAISVILGHSGVLSGRNIDPSFLGKGIGTWAVYIFFGISGYLITASAFSNNAPTYFTKRIARIFPAYLCVQFFTAFILAPIIHFIQNGSLNGFLTNVTTPFGYFIGNSMLSIKSYSIGNTLINNHFPGAWNGSTWTLWNEFFCYILILLVIKFLLYTKKNTIPLVIFLGWILTSFFTNHLIAIDAVLTNSLINMKILIPLLAFFLAGSLIYTFKKYIKFTVLLSIFSLIITILLINYLPTSGHQFAAPFIMYIIFTIANKLDSPKWIKENDLSYGIYLIAFPIQQLLDFGSIKLNTQLPYPVFFLISSVLTIFLAYFSWKFVEKPALSYAKNIKIVNN